MEADAGGSEEGVILPLERVLVCRDLVRNIWSTCTLVDGEHTNILPPQLLLIHIVVCLPLQK
jgi:hypothetical protein